MNTLKHTIPDKAALTKRLTSVLTADLRTFLNNTENRRARVRESLYFSLLACAFLVAISVFLYLTQAYLQSDTLFKIVVMFALLWSTVLFIFGRSWFSNTQLLAREINMALVPVLSQAFSRPFLYTHNDAKREEIANHLRTSKLLPVEQITVHTDDSFEIYGDTEVQFHELLVTRKGEGAPPPQTEEEEVFRGVLVVASLPQAHGAETYISTEGDKYHFAHRSFWDGLVGKHDVVETQLEWNDFEAALHVATTNEVAARELLTPDFMHELYDWWQEHKLNMRIAFKGGTMYLLLPEADIKIATSTTSRRLSVIQHYATTIARPIWRSLLLIESVARRGE